MGTSLTLFRIYDIKVRVHWSFLLILAYGAVIFSDRSNSVLVGAAYGVLVMLLLFLCVTLHEFGHALVARRFGIKVPHITLLPIGGVASLERMPDKPSQELMIAVAGPLVNVVITLILLPVALLIYGFNIRNGGDVPSAGLLFRQMQQPGATNLLLYLIFTNVLLAVFNLLPAFPMDGGRILRAVLAMGMPYVKATRIAVIVGRLMAVLFALWGIFGGGIFLLLIAFFVYVGGSAELESVQNRSALRGIAAARALTPAASNLYTSEPLSRAVALIMNSYQTDFAVLDLGGNFAGVLTRARLVGGLREAGETARIKEIMLPASEVPVCQLTTELTEVWESMLQAGSRVIAVLDHNRFVGLITADDITEVINVMGGAREGTQRNAPSDSPPTPSSSYSEKAGDAPF